MYSRCCCSTDKPAREGQSIPDRVAIHAARNSRFGTKSCPETFHAPSNHASSQTSCLIFLRFFICRQKYAEAPGVCNPPRRYFPDLPWHSPFPIFLSYRMQLGSGKYENLVPPQLPPSPFPIFSSYRMQLGSGKCENLVFDLPLPSPFAIFAQRDPSCCGSYSD